MTVTVPTTREGYNELLSQAYGRIYGDDPQAWGTLANSDLRRLFPAPTGRVLDLGCGHGKNLSHLLRAGATVEAVDVCDRALGLVRDCFAAEVASGQLTLVHGDEGSMTGAYDLVVCSGVLVDHLAERRWSMAERIMGSLGPNGRALVTVFGRRDPACGIGRRIEPQTFVHDFGFPVHYFSRKELRDMFAAGSTVLDCYTRTKQDTYPVPHLHETHVLVAERVAPAPAERGVDRRPVGVGVADATAGRPAW